MEWWRLPVTDVELTLSPVAPAFLANVGNDPLIISEARPGVVAAAGLLFRANNWAARVDLKFYVEKTSYPGGGLTVQWIF